MAILYSIHPLLGNNWKLPGSKWDGNYRVTCLRFGVVVMGYPFLPQGWSSIRLRILQKEMSRMKLPRMLQHYF
ncbi:hypothetical protein EAH73_12640 [Hymenobacter nivis]|uniref:Uncharacterized protein n=1 Tax=Hymenobacter nivis TaxID=1850093 RepID=A0A502GSI7_9BACT|nr:hypothetical protein EAH73_12640 [Hymenobacter nivis]